MSTETDAIISTISSPDGLAGAYAQTVAEVLECLSPIIDDRPDLVHSGVVQRFIQPDYETVFSVAWIDDSGHSRINRGVFVGFSEALGRMCGGLRIHPSVDAEVIRLLALDTTIKNALTTLPLGGCFGGADFDPKGKTEGEVMRFCQSFATALSRHAGNPAAIFRRGIGVGTRELGYLFGQAGRLASLTSEVTLEAHRMAAEKPVLAQAAGFGCACFARQMLAAGGVDIAGKKAAISGSGSLALGAARKAARMGARVITISDTAGYMVAEDGFDMGLLDSLAEASLDSPLNLEDIPAERGVTEYRRGPGVWKIPTDLALACATQGEIDADDVRPLADNGCRVVCEGANRAVTSEAHRLLNSLDIPVGTYRAANIGDIIVDGLVTTGALPIMADSKEAERRLETIITAVHRSCLDAAGEHGKNFDYTAGAIITAFNRIAEAEARHGNA